MSEEVIFSSGNVIVSKTLVRIEQASYPIQGIGSVMVDKPVSPGLRGLSVFFGFCSFLGFLGYESRVLGLIFLGLSLLSFYFALNRANVLVLRTASGDQNALRSIDKSHLDSVKNAIEKAVALRG
jgi:Family of unknown function (DUF6232)